MLSRNNVPAELFLETSCGKHTGSRTGATRYGNYLAAYLAHLYGFDAHGGDFVLGGAGQGVEVIACKFVGGHLVEVEG